MKDMQTIIVGNTHGLREGKNAIATAITRADMFRQGSVWHSASVLEHNTVVEAVNHSGRHTTTTGEVLLVESLDSPPVKVQVEDIKAVELDRLTDADFQALGYADRADYMADWGNVIGSRVWLMRIRRSHGFSGN